MSELRRHLFFLLEPDGRSLYVNNGVVTSSNLKRFLRYAPIGSKELQVIWERDRDKIGLTRNYAPELQFILDAKQILDKTHYAQTEEREMYLLIQQLVEEYTPTDFAEYHKFLYKGKLDFYKGVSDDSRFKIEIAESTIVKKIKANEGTASDFSLEDKECVTVYHDGVNMAMSAKYLIPFSDTQYRQNHFLDFIKVNADGESGTVAFHDAFGGQIPFNYDYATQTNYWLSGRYATAGIKIKGEVKMRPNHPDGHYTIYMRSSFGRTINIKTVNNPFGIVTIPFDITVNLLAGERFFLGATRVSAFSGIVSYFESFVTVSLISRLPGSYVSGYPMPVLHRKVVGEMTGSEANAAPSTSLNDDHVITSGDGMRSIPKAVVKMSGKDLYAAQKAIYGVGMSVEQEKVRIEPYGYYRSTANPVQLANISGFSSEVANEELATQIEIGYPSQSIEGVNGKASFHNTSVYSGLRQTADPKTKQFISPIIACPFAQEIIRINLDGKTTTDSSSDNKAYILDTEKLPDEVKPMQFYQEGLINKIRVTNPDAAAHYFWKSITISGTTSNNRIFTITAREVVVNDYILTVTENVTAETVTATISYSVRRLKRPTFTSIEGVPDPATIYNVLLAPSFLYRVHRKWINSMFYGFEGKKLLFKSTDKNRAFKVVYNGVTYDEDADITIGKDRLFIPRIFVFNVPAPVNLVELKEADPNRPFLFDRNGVSVVGFDVKASIGLSDGKEQGFRLLCGPDVDLKQLQIA